VIPNGAFVPAATCVLAGDEAAVGGGGGRDGGSESGGCEGQEEGIERAHCDLMIATDAEVEANE
jgi:hypothetical protein